MVSDLSDAIAYDYSQLSGFTEPTAPGHKGRLYLGTLGYVPVVVLQGRLHLYEGHQPAAIVRLIHQIAEFGCEVLIVTNSAGGIREGLEPGTLVLIEDHINQTGISPLVGPNDDSIGPRFPDMSNAYSANLRRLAQEVASDVHIALPSGVYLGTLGPSFETPAEVRAMRQLGADIVGMSTVPEVVVARHAGLEVLGISTVTNRAAGLDVAHLSDDHTLTNAEHASPKLRKLIRGIVRKIAEIQHQ